MSKLSVISFDFWNTFALPNPEFAKARNEYLKKEFAIGSDTYLAAKMFLDQMVKNSVGYPNPTPELAIMLLFAFKGDVKNVDYTEIQKHFNMLFKRYPPIITQDIFDSVALIKRDNLKWGIISNTNFISGASIREYLDFLELVPDFSHFSDEDGYSKPSQQAFKILGRVSTKKNSILHIGDDIMSDGVGAKNYGIVFKHIEHQKEILPFMANLKTLGWEI